MLHGSGSGPLMRGYGHGFMANGQNGWMGFLPLAACLIFWIVIVVLAVILLRRCRSKAHMMQKQNDPALLILRERYALGEIETEEFNQRKQDLSPDLPTVKS